MTNSETHRYELDPERFAFGFPSYVKSVGKPVDLDLLQFFCGPLSLRYSESSSMGPLAVSPIINESLPQLPKNHRGHIAKRSKPQMVPPLAGSFSLTRTDKGGEKELLGLGLALPPAGLFIDLLLTTDFRSVRAVIEIRLI